jgi:hypothetical protein
MEEWLKKEETEKSISFLRKEAEPNRGKTKHEWTKKHIYVCARMGTGGQSKYVPKHPEREKKIPNKRMDCPCRVVGKSYPGTSTILGKYEDSHSHPIGAQNLIYTRIPPEIRRKFEEDLRDGIRPEIAVSVALLFMSICQFLISFLLDSLRELVVTYILNRIYLISPRGLPDERSLLSSGISAASRRKLRVKPYAWTHKMAGLPFNGSSTSRPSTH